MGKVFIDGPNKILITYKKQKNEMRFFQSDMHQTQIISLSQICLSLFLMSLFIDIYISNSNTINIHVKKRRKNLIIIDFFVTENRLK